MVLGQESIDLNKIFIIIIIWLELFDSSREWSYVNEYKKRQLGIDKMVDGEFW